MTAGTAVPQTAEEFEELLHDGARMGAALEDGSFAGMVKDYAQHWAGKNTDMVQLFNEQMQAGWQEFVRDQIGQGGQPPESVRPWGRGGAGPLPAPVGRAGRRARAIAMSQLADAAVQAEKQSLFCARAPGAPLDDGEAFAKYTRDLKSFLYATLKGEHMARQRGDTAEAENIQGFKAAIDKAWQAGIQNALGERVPSEGGFLIPENLRAEILMMSLETAVMRPRATVIPMDSLRVPLPSIDDTSHTANVFGGVFAAWTEEGAALSVSAPKFSRVILEARKLTAFTEIPNELLQDSVTPLDVWFSTFFPQAISFFEDLAFIGGTGAGEPEGILNCPGAVTVAAASGGHIQFVDVAKAFARLWPASMRRAIWLCEPQVLAELLQLAASADGGGTTVAPPGWLQAYQAIGTPGGGDGGGYDYTLMGRPLRVSEKVPYMGGGKAGALSLVDPSFYLIGDRMAMQVASSDQYAFGQDMMAYRVIERLDGRGWLRTPLTPANGSANTLSPYVLVNS